MKGSGASHQPVRVTRRTLLRASGMLVGGAAFSGVLTTGPARASTAAAPVAAVRAQEGGVKVRWLGGGVAEVATPDDRQIAYVDAWIWNNAGWERFGVQKPPELTSAAAFAEHVRARSPEAVLVLLTHDHGDHMGDYFELLSALAGAGINVKTVGQSDMMRVGLVQRFREASLDPTQIVANGGAGANIGGRAVHGEMRAWAVPAFHSTTLGFPAIGFILEIGGVRLYCSGDTDLYGDLALVGQRYQPHAALVCAGDGPFTMDSRAAAWACQLLGVKQAIPIHYAHNAAVAGPEAGEAFRQAAAELAPDVAVQVLTPGQSTVLGA